MASFLIVDTRTPYQADLARWGHQPTFVKGTEEASASLKTGSVDVVLIGPTAQEAAQACAALVDRFPQVPVIVATSDELTRKRSARAGAWEVASPDAEGLESTVRRAVEVRQLRQALERKSSTPTDAANDLPSLDTLEREHIFRVLASVKGHRTKAAQLLGLDRKTLYRKLSRYRELGLTA